MKAKVLVLALIVVSLLLVGCGSKSNDYSGYASGDPQGQQPYVGGGCGVAPQADYESTPTGPEAGSEL